MPTSNEVIVLIVLVAINIIVVAFKALLEGYGKKKGENLATKEDLRDVVDQVKAVTRTAEEIKAELSEKSWSKQRHWDLKRDTAIEIMRVYADLQLKCGDLMHASSVLHVLEEINTTTERRSEAQKKSSIAFEAVQSASSRFSALAEIARLVFSKELSVKIEALRRSFNNLAVNVTRDHTLYEDQAGIVMSMQDEVVLTMRAELGL